MLPVGRRGSTAGSNGSSMTDAKYQLWRNGIPYAGRLMDDLNYDKFSETRLMPSLIAKKCIPAHGYTQL